ncbi:hypothetical protein O181_105839 [Austropuccinia psidii MF-1]|uniref:Uncharacterized protein n=1 Tax=Austropuccinia psidii MF-1 TaxID=1389203 RepID=A0A9Q3JQX7_9BASI|nr:hypothetical protein [Austropuccinia psidii MF-1]
MPNAISQRDEIIAALMQQAEDANNPWDDRNNKRKDKGKGRRISFQDTIPSPPLPSSSKSKPVVKTQKSPAPIPNLTSTIRHNPIQMLMRDAPPDFKYTKIHIKLLWGVLTPAAIPREPDKRLLKEFYQLFSSAEEVHNVPQNFQGVKLISEAQVQTLCDAYSGKRKIGKNIINMKDFYITYVHATLAKLGICIWAPDSIYNEACHIVALMTF